MLIKIKQDNMDHGAKQARYGKGGVFGRNTNKLVRAKTGPSLGEKISNVGEKISSTIGNAFNKEKPTSTTPPQKEMVQSQILNEYDSPASRLQSEFGGLNQDALNPAQNAAMTAGGSRPMTAMNNPQIDPITGMPITPGGQPNMNPNFIGGMANSNMPTTAMLAQETSVLEDLKGFGKNVISDLHKADSLIKNFADKAALKVGILNEDEYARRNKNMPGAFGITKTPQDKAMPTGDAGKGVRSLPSNVQEKMGYDPLSQERLTQSRRSTKCMRVKKK